MHLRELGQKPCLSPSAFFSLIQYFHSCDPQTPGRHVHQRQLKANEVIDISNNNNTDTNWHQLIKSALQWSQHTRYSGTHSSEKAAPTAWLCTAAVPWAAPTQSPSYTGGQAAQSQHSRWPRHPRMYRPCHIYFIWCSCTFASSWGISPYFMLLCVELSFGIKPLLQHSSPKGPNSWKNPILVLLWPLGVQHYSSNRDFPKQGCPWCLHKFHGHCNKCRLVIFI